MAETFAIPCSLRALGPGPREQVGIDSAPATALPIHLLGLGASTGWRCDLCWTNFATYDELVQHVADEQQMRWEVGRC